MPGADRKFASDTVGVSNDGYGPVIRPSTTAKPSSRTESLSRVSPSSRRCRPSDASSRGDTCGAAPEVGTEREHRGVKLRARLVREAQSCLDQVTTLGPERLDEFDWGQVPVIELPGG